MQKDKSRNQHAMIQKVKITEGQYLHIYCLRKKMINFQFNLSMLFCIAKKKDSKFQVCFDQDTCS
jgi:hypothetical protein